MTRTLTLLVALLALLSTAAFVSSPREDSEIDQHMKAINKSSRQLRAMLKDPAKAEAALAVILSMQEHALKAKALNPKKLETIEGDEARAKFTLEYRKGMHEFLNGMFEIEVALLGGDNEAAGETLKGLLKAKSPAHEKFKLDDN